MGRLGPAAKWKYVTLTISQKCEIIGRRERGKS
jgi:hypothetical protein